MYFLVAINIIVSLYFVFFRNFKFGLFTKEKTSLLKAILPYLIFVHHSHLFDSDFHYAGAFICALFFFMSGYGLETKHQLDAIKFRELPKSITKLLVPLLVPVMLYLVMRLLNGSFDTVIEDNVKKYQIILPYTWFVLTLIILYISFYFCASLTANTKSHKWIFLCLITCMILSFYFLGYLLNVTFWARSTTPAFIAGIFYKISEFKIINKLNVNTKPFIASLSIILILITIYINHDFIGYVNNSIKIPLLAFIWPLFFLILYSIIPYYKTATIKFLSSISYELYICQSIGFLIIADKHQYSPVVYLIVLFIVCTIVALLCKKVTKQVFHKCGY